MINFNIPPFTGKETEYMAKAIQNHKGGEAPSQKGIAGIGNSVRMPAGEKRKIWDGCVVPVPLSCQADKAHGRMRTVPLQVR